MYKEKVVLCDIKKNSIKKSVNRIFREFKFNPKLYKNILIKPNWVCPRSSQTGATTNLRLVEAVINYLLKKDVNIIIGEGAGYEFNTNKVFDILNVKHFSKKYDIDIINLRKEKTRKVNLNGKILKKINIPKSVLKADLILNLPKLKTHIITGISFAMKNLIGLLPDEERRKIHVFGLDQAILDLNNYFYDKTFTIGDAITIISGRGPVFGDPLKTDILIGGRNAIAVDKIICEKIGIDYKTIGHIKLSVDQKKLISNIDVVGDKIDRKSHIIMPDTGYFYKFNYWLIYLLDYFIKPFLRKSSIPLIMTRFGTKLEINHDLCTKCGKCINVCPVNAISKDYKIDFEKCRYVRCFRCYEVCEDGAITIKGFSKPKKAIQKS